MNRRHFLSSATQLGALSLGLNLANSERLFAQTKLPVGKIDTHVHFYDPSRPEGVPWPDPKSPLYRPVFPNHYRKVAQGNQVDGVIVVEASKWFQDNQWVFTLAENEPLILGLIGNIFPGQPQFAQQLQEIAQQPLFLGLRMAAPSLGPDLTRFTEYNRVLEVNAKWEVFPDILKIAAAFPEQRIVLNHLPIDPNPDPALAKTQRQLLREVASAPNVFAKISNVIRRQNDQFIPDPSYYTSALEELWTLFGEDRVFFGSNWPVSDLFGPYHFLQKVVGDFFAQKGPVAEAKYFAKNSARIYHWKARTPGQEALL